MNLSDYRHKTTLTFYHMGDKLVPTSILEFDGWLNDLDIWFALGDQANFIDTSYQECLDLHIRHTDLLNNDRIVQPRHLRKMTNSEMNLIL